jgi:hypothetical protein
MARNTSLKLPRNRLMIDGTNIRRTMFLLTSDVRAWSALFAVMAITVPCVLCALSQRTIPVERITLSELCWQMHD